MSEESERKTLVEQIELEHLPSDAGTPAGAESLAARVEKTRTRQKSYVLDLRIHSPASLGYLAIEGIDTAPALVRLAKVKGLDVIAVTDYYSGQFIDRISAAARESQLVVLPGCVIRCCVGSCDDVILTCLFPEGSTTATIESFLRSLSVPSSASGDRSFLVRLPLEKILAELDARGALALPSRMDKTPHRMAAMPILVERFGFRAFDLAYADSARYFRSRWPKLKFQLFSFSNANALAQVGSRTAKVKMADPGFAGIRSLVARQSAEEAAAALAPRARR